MPKSTSTSDDIHGTITTLYVAIGQNNGKQSDHANKYECNVCNTLFKHECNLKIHAIIHTPSALSCLY